MKADRLSGKVALLSQALFAVLLSVSSWNTAAYGALSLASVSLVLGIACGTGGFPRPELGSLLCFASMSAVSLLLRGLDLFPYTGLFFALGLGAASLTAAVFPAMREKSLHAIHAHSFAVGAGYVLAATLHQVFFPRPSYLYLGVGCLVVVSILDLASGIFFSVKAAREAVPRKPVAKPPFGTGIAIFVLCSLAVGAPKAAAQTGPAAQTDTAIRIEPSGPNGRTEEELFAALFGEESTPERKESSDDPLVLAAMEVETPPGFTEAYIRSFARELEVGMRLTRGELEGAMRAIRERMDFSRRFYRAGVSYLPIDGMEVAGTPEIAGTTKVAVKITAGDGFWWDFNYEPHDISVGYKNLFRSGKELQAVAGLNTQALRYRDPAIANGVFYYAAALTHRVGEDAHLADSAYLYESISGEGETGLSIGDDLRLGLGALYAAYRAASEYFLYPEFAPPERLELERLGMSGGLDVYAAVASFSLRSSLGAYSYQRRGGIHGRVEGSLAELVPMGAPSEATLKTTISGDLRFDAALKDASRLLRLTFHERVEYFPRNLDGRRTPEPLWADIDEGRYRSGLVSGEFASLSRASLGLDAITVIGLGFTQLSLIPELYYEFTVVRMEDYDDSPRWAQNIGFLIKGAFSAPVNRIFSLGLAFGLPSDAAKEAEERGPGVALFLEIE